MDDLGNMPRISTQSTFMPTLKPRLISILLILFAGVGVGLGTGCGNGLHLDPHPKRPVAENLSRTEDLLSAPQLDLDSTASPVFHPILSEQNYEAVLQMNDLSYAVVNDFGYSLGQSFPPTSQISKIRARLKDISQRLTAQGWSSYQPILGRTGRDNVDPDITAIVHTHTAQRLIVVAFHGSRSGSRNPSNDGHGDWGSNYDSTPVAPSEIGITEMPDSIRIHRGFGNNLASARESLWAELDARVEELGTQAPLWIWVTGHSKGGAMGGLAAPMIKVHFASKGQRFANVKVAGILFSSPRAVQGDPSQAWVHETVGRANLLRINVNGDPVTVALGRSATGYRSLGTLLSCRIGNCNPEDFPAPDQPDQPHGAFRIGVA